MNKNEIVQIMCDVVNKLNFEVAQSQGADMNDAKVAIEQHQPHLVYVNSIILDALASKGLVNID